VKNTMRIDRIMTRLGLLTFTLLLGSAGAFAQGTAAAADTLTGKYEGTLKSAGSADEKISLELKNDGGKISGHAMHGADAMDITEGTFKDGTLSLRFGKETVLTAKVQGDKLAGDLVSKTRKGSVELMKVMPAGPAAAAPASGPVDLSGQWDAVADANGQPFPFALTLKVEGEGVTGGSSSQLGDSTIKQGSWKDGKLVIQLEGQNGVVSLSATVVEGKLTGEFDYSGQLQGKWVAIKKN
jgi:hypothetical protein